MKCSAVVLAAGRGRRMESKIEKQFLELNGKPLIYYALNCFQSADCVQEIILVTGQEQIEYCRNEIVERYHLSKVTKIVPGGAERYNSVYEGLKACTEADYVMIHDGARPFVTPEILKNGLAKAVERGSAVAGMPVKDTIKIVDRDNTVLETPDRSSVWLVQTPQIFRYALVRSAYDMLQKENATGVTDDAMVVERYGKEKVHMFEASYTNIKITTPEDMEVAKIFLKN